MANPEHVKILEQGVDAWKDWRKAYPTVSCDLSNANLARAQLEGGEFDGVDFREANLVGAVLSGAALGWADLRKADLRHADLSQADLTEAALDDANLAEANLVRTHLGGAHLIGANLFGAFLRRADFADADVSRTCFVEAWLAEAVFSSATFAGADLTAAVLSSTIFQAIDLSAVQGLERVIHWGPSAIGIDTIYLSKGDIPEVFLRGAGVPEDFIVYMRSLAAHPIEFYSCFISYSSKDEEFALRLHTDLQQANVRCWFAPEDLKIGDKFRAKIDESIRLYDKLMVILTENSIASSWVEEEVEAALEKERKQAGKLVLFPIRLDDAVMETDQAWASSLRRTRHIGDFTNWKDRDAFTTAFDRLLRDLKSSGK